MLPTDITISLFIHFPHICGEVLKQCNSGCFRLQINSLRTFLRAEVYSGGTGWLRYGTDWRYALWYK